MSGPIDPNDVYHVLKAIRDELPPGAATLERDSDWGRSQLSPKRQGAAALYGVGNIEECEIGIVGVTHCHFDNWSEAIEFCRLVVRGNIEYTVWYDGPNVVRAQRHHPDKPNVVDLTEALFKKPVAHLREERLRFAPWVI